MADRTIDSLSTNARRILGLFAKAWDPGKVKTRLAKTLGDEAAVEIYRSLLTVNLMWFHHAADHRCVAYSPSDDATKLRFESFIAGHKPMPQWGLLPQEQGDLGARMSVFFQQQFEFHGAESRVVLIGSDALWLTCEIVEEAFELLNTHDVVFGPSTDGGYYLVGLSKHNKEVFTDIEWSTEKVLSQSLRRCESEGLKVAQLETLTDIDDENDLRREVQLLREKEIAEVDAIRQLFLMDIDRILGRDWP